MKYQDVDIETIANSCLEEVFRETVDKPGFIHLDFGPDLTSAGLREVMIQLKEALSLRTQRLYNKRLHFQWLGRFDQQSNTKYHLDNAGNQSFLMLGYEPSEIESELYLADYVKFSLERKNEPSDFFQDFNPLFKNNEKLLDPFTTKVESFTNSNYQIILINNSNSKEQPETLGVLHLAKIIKQDLTKSRVINSMMLNLSDDDHLNLNIDIEHFLTTNEISK